MKYELRVQIFLFFSAASLLVKSEARGHFQSKNFSLFASGKVPDFGLRILTVASLTCPLRGEVAMVTSARRVTSHLTSRHTSRRVTTDTCKQTTREKSSDTDPGHKLGHERFHQLDVGHWRRVLTWSASTES